MDRRTPPEAGAEAERSSRFEPFLYTLTMAATGTGRFSGAFQLDQDADFVLTSTVGRGNIALTTVISTLVTIGIQSQRGYENIPIPVGCLFGEARRPYIWPAPRRILRGSYIQVIIEKLAAQSITSFQFGFDGFKVIDSVSEVLNT